MPFLALTTVAKNIKKDVTFLNNGVYLLLPVAATHLSINAARNEESNT